MKSYPLFHVDAFAARAFGGNPAGVVFDAQGLSGAAMQLVARELRHSETAFLSPSRTADYRVRFYTPAREVDLCGHASIAAAWAMASEGRLKRGRARQETNVGVLDLDVGRDGVFMEQARPRVEPADVRPRELAALLGVAAIDTTRPVQRAYTGNWVLIVPMPDEKAINLCEPKLSELAALNMELGVTGTHLFAVEPDGTLYARHFAPAVGIPEDPVTGTANGALGGYLVLNGLAKGPAFKARQGDAMGRPGEIEIYATAREVRVGGKCVIFSRGMITF